MNENNQKPVVPRIASFNKAVKYLTVDVVSPSELKAGLDDHAVGQNHAKKALALAMHRHLMNIKYEGTFLPRSNVLLLGGTGTGKTYLTKRIAEMVNLPFVHIDCSSLSATGYVGASIATTISDTLQHCPVAYRKLQPFAVVFLDEIDKLADLPDSQNNVSTLGVQYELLRVLEGTNLVSQTMGAGTKTINLTTDNMLFIAAGAFSGLEEQIRSKEAGFSASRGPRTFGEIGEDNLPDPEDLIKYGLIPELVGRLNSITSTNALTKEDLRAILTRENGPIEQFKRAFASYNTMLVIEESLIQRVVEAAFAKNVGARGLTTLLELELQNIQYEVFSGSHEYDVKIMS